jgi:hypothetical protein
MRRSRVLSLLLILGGSLVAGLVAAEVVVRLRHPEATRRAALQRIERERDTWRRPHAAFHHVGEGIFKLRFADPAGPTRPRVMIVGDSFAMGHGVDEKSRFGTLLQSRLGGSVDVDVLATSSYSPIIYRNIVRRALSSARYLAIAVFVDQTDPPDDVIYRNDLVPGPDPHRFNVDLMTEREAMVADTYDRLLESFDGWSGVARRSALFNRLRPPTLLADFPRDTDHYSYVRLSLARSLLIQAFQEFPRDEATREMESLLFRHLDEIVTLSRERRTPVILTANPWEFQVSRAPRTGFSFQGPFPRENRLETVLDERYGDLPGVIVLGLTGVFRGHDDPSSLFLGRPRNEVHWSRAGHIAVERALNAVLQEHVLEPLRSKNAEEPSNPAASTIPAAAS